MGGPILWATVVVVVDVVVVTGVAHVQVLTTNPQRVEVYRP